jgi:Uncharacterized alpha/beta hydrolase domain (DUF2235)
VASAWLALAARLTRAAGYLIVVAALLIYLCNYLKIVPGLSGFGVLKRLATLHLTRFQHQFYDTTLNVNVGYAKHAIAIDEDRADFARVGWSPTAEKQDKRDTKKNLYFEQVWFPGVHADIGGGYLARLRLRPTRRVYCYHIAEDSVRLAMLVNDGQMQARIVVLAQKLPTWASPLQGNNRLSRVLQSH